MSLKIHKITEDDFDTLRANDNLPSDTAWELDDGTFGYTPDGEGCLWYDTAEELREMHDDTTTTATHLRDTPLPTLTPGTTFNLYGETWRYNGPDDWERTKALPDNADHIDIMDDWEMRMQHFDYTITTTTDAEEATK